MYMYISIWLFSVYLLLGNKAWPTGVFLKYTAGDQLGPINMVSVKPLDASEYYDLSVNMISPEKTGMYQGQWRMCTPTGQYFGGEQDLCSFVWEGLDIHYTYHIYITLYMYM